MRRSHRPSPTPVGPPRRPSTRGVAGDRGGATVAAVACLGLLLLVGLALGEVGAWFAAHRQVRAAADLAALAGAGAVTADPCGRAEAVAGSNGARLLSCAVEGRTVRVVVGIDAPTRLGPAHELTGTAVAGPG
ncbi:Rv3654c family TadE-like protein [Nocardioides ginkgobilobae]